MGRQGTETSRVPERVQLAPSGIRQWNRATATNEAFVARIGDVVCDESLAVLLKSDRRVA
jgi:hypothetical protein